VPRATRSRRCSTISSRKSDSDRRARRGSPAPSAAIFHVSSICCHFAGILGETEAISSCHHAMVFHCFFVCLVIRKKKKKWRMRLHVEASDVATNRVLVHLSALSARYTWVRAASHRRGPGGYVLSKKHIHTPAHLRTTPLRVST